MFSPVPDAVCHRSREATCIGLDLKDQGPRDFTRAGMTHFDHSSGS